MIKTQIKKFLLCLPVNLRENIRQEAKAKGISQNSLILTILWEHYKQ